jgi:hypothetical protein
MPSRLRCAIVVLVVFGVLAPLRAAAPPSGPDAARVRVLLHRLDADSFHTRQKADEALRAMGKGALPLLKAERERTSSLEVRYRLDRMVYDLTIDERIPGLVQLLGHQNPAMSNQAALALRQAGAGAAPLLRKELRPELQAAHRQRLEKIIAELSASAR